MNDMGDRSPRNLVFRYCQNCGKEEEQETFSYCGDGVWSCFHCGSMWTIVSRVEEGGE